jgi:uncharacterized membrane protein
MLAIPLLTYVYKESNTKFTKYIVMMSILLFNPITVGAFDTLMGLNGEFANLQLMLTIPAGLTLVDMINIYLIPKFKRV